MASLREIHIELWQELHDAERPISKADTETARKYPDVLNNSSNYCAACKACRTCSKCPLFSLNPCKYWRSLWSAYKWAVIDERRAYTSTPEHTRRRRRAAAAIRDAKWREVYG